jgi:cell division transport system permease protein
MTEPSEAFDQAGTDIAEAADTAATGSRGQRRSAPIVPAQNIAGRALVTVIAIMTFLSCLTFGAVTLVRDTASAWESQISREATIQIKPADGLDMEAALSSAAEIAGSAPGIKAARIVDRDATARLLEPWLGTGLDIDDLPVPRLVVITLDPDGPPDFAALRAALSAKLPTASLDDHRTWVDRLVAMAHSTVTIGVAVLALMLIATVLTVVFATRGAMAGNGHIIEVLHFVGAEARFIARQFRRHFLVTGMKGAAAGGLAAAFVFIVFSWWSSRSMATPGGDQAAALFGHFAIGWSGYFGVILMVLVIGALTAATSHATVVAYLSDIEVRQTEG